jgi:hypothetical protein
MKKRLFGLAAAFSATFAILYGAAEAQVIGAPTPPAAPLTPYTGHMTLLNATSSIGPAAGQRLVVTTLILTNFDTSPQQVFLFVPIFSGGNKTACGGGGSSIVGGTTPQMTFYVQPQQTLVIPLPSGMVFFGHPVNCLAGEVTTLLHGGSITLDANGYTQPAHEAHQ